MSAIEKYTPGAPAIAEITDRQWGQLEKKANVYAKTALSPERWRGEEKVPDILAVGLTLHSVGVDLTLSTLNQCYVISGQVQMMAQLQIGIADSHGIDCWFEPDAVSETEATICIRKRGGARVDRYRYTIAMARKAHLLDEVVERWMETRNGKKYPERVIVRVDGQPVDEPIPQWAQKLLDEGRVKRKDPWFNNRQQMLMARATTLGLKVAAPSVLLGLPNVDLGQMPPPAPAVAPETSPDATPATAKAQDLDEDTVDAELVDDENETANEGEGADGATAAAMPGDTTAAPGEVQGQTNPAGPALEPTPREQGQGDEGSPAVAAPDGSAPSIASEGDREHLRERIAALGEEWKEHVAVDWRVADIPPLKDEAFTTEHLAAAGEIVTGYAHKKGELELKRQKQVNAHLTEIGITSAAERHEFIRKATEAATDGVTESSAGLSLSQHQHVMMAISAHKVRARNAANAEAAPPGDGDQAPMWDDDDPGRPFDA